MCVTLSSHFPFFVWATEASEGTNTSRQSSESHVETRSTSRCVLHCCVGVGVLRHTFHLTQILRAQALSLKFLFTARTQGACSQRRCVRVPVRRFRVSFRSLETSDILTTSSSWLAWELGRHESRHHQFSSGSLHLPRRSRCDRVGFRPTSVSEFSLRHWPSVF